MMQTFREKKFQKAKETETRQLKGQKITVKEDFKGLKPENEKVS
jgi:hypothetical protein